MDVHIEPKEALTGFLNNDKISLNQLRSNTGRCF